VSIKDLIISSRKLAYPHEHLKNGLPKRKNRHIVEVGLSLFAYASMPPEFFDEAFITAVYLINRHPHRAIESQTPMEHLFGDKDDYSFLQILVVHSGRIFVHVINTSWNFSIKMPFPMVYQSS
jgi:hypothetical protein